MSAAPLAIVLLSDTHGRLAPQVVEEAARADWVVHAGDIGGAAVLAALRPRLGIVAVRGNNDLPRVWAGAEARLGALPVVARLALPGGILAVEHGDAHPARERHGRLRGAHPDARLIVYGHSHRRVQDLGEQPWVVNPGAAGLARTFGGPSCLLLRVDSDGAAWHLEARVWPDARGR